MFDPSLSPRNRGGDSGFLKQRRGYAETSCVGISQP
jgi:hypothetical protein